MADSVQPGDVIDGRYSIFRLIGRGAMADVYQAKDLRFERYVAVKLLRSSAARQPEAFQRFMREARVQEMLEHENVARLYGGGALPTGQPYLVVELLRGRSLRTVIKREHILECDRACRYARAACNGLAAVHTMGVLHRDLKPANIMLEPTGKGGERVVLIDFGFAAFSNLNPSITMQGHVVGSLSYLSPERLHGEEGDERSDVYAMGIVLYELLTGRPPFVAADDYDLINKHIETPPIPPSRLVEHSVPAPVENIVLRSLAKNPGERQQSAAIMANELRRALKKM